MKNFLLLVLVISSSVIFAQEFKPEIKVGATIFTGFEYNLDNAEFISKLDTNSPDLNSAFGFKPVKNQFETGKNSFTLERVYINVAASLLPDLKSKVTTEVSSFTDGSGKTQFNMGIKVAYFEYTPFKCDNGFSLGFNLGLVSNFWTGTADKYWGYRGFAKTFTDYAWTTAAVKSGNTVSKTTGAFFPTADLGLQLNFTAPKGLAEIQASVVNGNGFKNLSYDNRFKDIFLTAFIHPLQPKINKKTETLKKIINKFRLEGITDLTLGGFLYMGKLDKGENYAVNGVQYERNRMGGMFHMRYNFKKAGFVKFGGEYSMQKNVDPSVYPSPTEKAETSPKGFSSYIEFNPPVPSLDEKLMLIFRYDSFDPDIYEPLSTITGTPYFDKSHSKQNLIIGGLAFKPNKMLTFGVTYHGVTYEDNFVVKYDGTTTKTDSKLLIHGVLNF